MRILHFADLHIGMEAYGQIDPATGLNRRVVDFLKAFDDVVDYALENEADLVLFCGDAFKNRDPSPTYLREFAARLRRLLEAGIPTFLLVGNHDLAALGRLDAGNFNLFARAALEWTREQLSPSVRAFLEHLRPRETFQDLLLVHASPQDPVHEYILDWETADDNFRAEPFSVCLFGHTHVPVRFTHDGVRTQVLPFLPHAPLQLSPQLRHLVNVGSVGQPRDGDPRAAYTVLDTEARTVELRRVSYPVEAVQRKMQARGLPGPLWERLAEGR
ncbi:MAG: metallophosphoesterase [candidate division GAL15 bacterium]